MANGVAGAFLGFLCGRSTTASSLSSSMAVERTTPTRNCDISCCNLSMMACNRLTSARAVGDRRSWWCCEWIGVSRSSTNNCSNLLCPSARRPSSFLRRNLLKTALSFTTLLRAAATASKNWRRLRWSLLLWSCCGLGLDAADMVLRVLHHFADGGLGFSDETVLGCNLDESVPNRCRYQVSPHILLRTVPPETPSDFIHQARKIEVDSFKQLKTRLNSELSIKKLRD